MGLFNNSDDDIQGILLNFDQKQPYNSNFLIGKIIEETPLRGDEILFKWHPGDAKTVEDSKGIEKNRVDENCMYEYAEGKVSPFPVTIILPEEWKDLPRSVRSVSNEDLPPLGAIFQSLHYQVQSQMEGFKAVAEEQPEILEKMKQITISSELDEKQQEKFVEMIDTVMDSVNRNYRSKSNRNK